MTAAQRPHVAADPRLDGPPAAASPPVTVVVPTVDREALLVRAVRSVLAQDYPGAVEIVVVRDGGPAPDRRQVELERAVGADLHAGRTRLRWVPNSRTPGLPGARNSGILAARHPLVGFCDDDDEWRPGKLAAQVPLLLRSPDASMVATGVTVVTHRPDRDRSSVRIGPLRPVSLEDLLNSRIMELHPSSFLFRRADLLGPIGLVDERLPGGYAEDYDLLLRAAGVGPVLSVPRPLIRVHWHGSSFYFSKWQMIHDALEALLAKHPQFAGAPRGRARIRGQQAIALAAMGRRREGLRAAVDTARLHVGEPRAYLAAVIAGGLVSVETVQAHLHAHGRGL